MHVMINVSLSVITHCSVFVERESVSVDKLHFDDDYSVNNPYCLFLYESVVSLLFVFSTVIVLLHECQTCSFKEHFHS